MRIYWIESDRSRSLAIVPRPRGGDWLEDDLRAIRGEGVAVLVSLLTLPEQEELGLTCESSACQAAEIEFLNYAITDRTVPESVESFSPFVERLSEFLGAGLAVGAHCRAGIGRSSLLIASLLCDGGMDVKDAFRRISAARGLSVPDTPEQVAWVESFSRRLR